MSKNCFESKYTDRKVGAAQYIAELICENVAKQQKTDLPYKFWNNEKWSKLFKYQVVLAQGLLKIYRAEAIIRVVRKPEFAWISSLAVNKLEAAISEEQKSIERFEQAANIEANTPITAGRQPFQLSKKSILNKLKDL